MITDSKTRLAYNDLIHLARDFLVNGTAASQNPTKNESFIKENNLLSMKTSVVIEVIFLMGVTTDCDITTKSSPCVHISQY